MTPRPDEEQRFADILGEHPDPVLLRLTAALDRSHKDTPPPHLDATIRHAVQEHAAHPRLLLIPAGRPRTLRWPRRYLAAVVAALLIGLSGVAGYLRVSAPTPVSAQSVLRRAAAAVHLAPHEAAHFVYSVAATSGYAGTGDVWIGADTGGALTLSAQTLAVAKDGHAAPGLNTRRVQAGHEIYTYDPRANTITLMAATRDQAGLPTDAFDGVRVAQYLSTLAAGARGGAQLRPQRTLDGHTVDVVEVDQGIGARTTFYFDAQSYLLRGIDQVTDGRALEGRLRAYAVLAAGAVPAHAFTLDAPATARVIPADPYGAFAAVCHLTKETLLTAQSRPGDQTPLGLCQAGDPAMTRSALIAALAAPVTGALEAAVAAGQITPAQDVASRATVQAQLTTFVTTPLRGPKGP